MAAPSSSEDPLERDPVIDAFRKDIDRTLFERNLKLSVEQRFRQLMEMQRFAQKLREAGRRASTP